MLGRITSILMGALVIALFGSSCSQDLPKTPRSSATSLSPSVLAKIGASQLNQRDMDELGWRMFVAYNWPAASGARGKPDPAKPIGTPGLPLVWETWKTPNEVFYPNGSPPVGWEQYGPIVPVQCTGAGKGAPNTPVILVNRINQAAGGALADANGNVVYYFISFNRPVFDLIYQNGYYNIAGQDRISGPLKFSVGAAEMKAAWRIVQPGEPEAFKRRFYRRNVYVYTPAIEGKPATCVFREVALIGLHFNLKVLYPDGSSQWAMATFEQVDNVPPFDTPDKPGRDPGHTLPYSLFDKACQDRGLHCIYNWSTDPAISHPPRPRVNVPSNAIRTVALDPETTKLNLEWQNRLRQVYPDSPWQYYELITTQFPLAGKPTPASSANSSMETFIKPSSCLDCHSLATDINRRYSSDYIYMLQQACPDPLFPDAGHGVRSAVCQKRRVAHQSVQSRQQQH